MPTSSYGRETDDRGEGWGPAGEADPGDSAQRARNGRAAAPPHAAHGVIAQPRSQASQKGASASFARPLPVHPTTSPLKQRDTCALLLPGHRTPSTSSRLISARSSEGDGTSTPVNPSPRQRRSHSFHAFRRALFKGGRSTNRGQVEDIAEGPRRLSSPSRGPARPSFPLTAHPPSSPDKAGKSGWVDAEAELLASSHVSPESSQRWIKRLDKPPGRPPLMLLLLGAEPLCPARARTESALAAPPPLAAPLAPHRALVPPSPPQIPARLPLVVQPAHRGPLSPPIGPLPLRPKPAS